MNQVKVGASEAANYSYDALGRRVKSVEGDVTAITIYSGNDVVYEARPSLTGPTVTTCYLTMNGKTLAKIAREGTNPAETFFLHTDLVGSIRAITDSTGQVVARFEYEPFGLTTQASGALAGETHKFTGKPEDGTGLYYYGARYYDPEAGRFTSSDPAKDGLNWYAYCLSNPLARVDDNGLWDSYRDHYNWTLTAAMSVGFTPDQAKSIARGAYDCDFGRRAPLPIIGDLSWHFNTNTNPWNPTDTRRAHLQESQYAAMDLIMRGRETEGFIELGYGLHALQDIYAHQQGTPGMHVGAERLHFVGWRVKPWSWWDDPLYDYFGVLNPTPYGPGSLMLADRAIDAIEETKSVLEQFFAWLQWYYANTGK